MNFNIWTLSAKPKSLRGKNLEQIAEFDVQNTAECKPGGTEKTMIIKQAAVAHSAHNTVDFRRAKVKWRNWHTNTHLPFPNALANLNID